MVSKRPNRRTRPFAGGSAGLGPDRRGGVGEGWKYWKMAVLCGLAPLDRNCVTGSADFVYLSKIEVFGNPIEIRLSSKLACLLERSPPVGLFRSGGHRPTLFFARNPNLRPKMAQNFFLFFWKFKNLKFLFFLQKLKILKNS